MTVELLRVASRSFSYIYICARCRSRVAFCLLVAARCSLLVVGRLSRFACWLLLGMCCSLFVVRCLLRFDVVVLLVVVCLLLVVMVLVVW